MAVRAYVSHHPRAALVVVLLALACVAAMITPAVATATGDTFTVRKVPAKVSLSELQDDARKVRAQMDRLKADVAEIGRKYEAARLRFAETGRQLADTRLRLTGTLAELDTQRALVAARAVAMYKATDMSFLDVLMGSTSFAELQSGVQLYDRVARQDRQAEGRLAHLARDARALERDIERQRRVADAAQRVIDEQRTELADKLAQRRAILEDLTRRIDELLAAGLPPGLGPVNGNYTQLSWAKAFAQKLAVPVTGANVAAITAWELAEGGHWHNSAHFNPLNTTQPMPGATSMNSVGVKAYTSWAQGFAATLKTIHNGYYEGILAALRRGDDAQAVADAVAESPWGTNSFNVAALTG
jgi:peptidoglycan hydrolase CwlO-like protein